MADNGSGGRPHRSEVHRRQRGKNLAVLALLLAAVVIIYFVALVRMSGGAG